MSLGKWFPMLKKTVVPLCLSKCRGPTVLSYFRNHSPSDSVISQMPHICIRTTVRTSNLTFVICSKPAEGKNPVGRPPKWRRLEMAEDSKTTSEDQEWKLFDEDSSERRRKKR